MAAKNYHFYADETVIYFVYEETLNQKKFDLIIRTLQKRFCGSKLKLNTRKKEFMKIMTKNSFNADLSLSTDSKSLNQVKFLLDSGRQFFVFIANQFSQLLLPAIVCNGSFIQSETQITGTS